MQQNHRTRTHPILVSRASNCTTRSQQHTRPAATATKEPRTCCPPKEGSPEDNHEQQSADQCSHSIREQPKAPRAQNNMQKTQQTKIKSTHNSQPAQSSTAESPQSNVQRPPGQPAQKATNHVSTDQRKARPPAKAANTDATQHRHAPRLHRHRTKCPPRRQTGTRTKCPPRPTAKHRTNTHSQAPTPTPQLPTLPRLP